MNRRILKIRKLDQTGMALVTVMVFSLFLFLMCGTYFDSLLGEKRLALANQNGFKAASIADAAVEEVFWRHNYNDFASDPAANGWTTSGTTASYGSQGSPIAFQNSSGTVIGNYYAVINNYATNPVLTVHANYTGEIGR